MVQGIKYLNTIKSTPGYCNRKQDQKEEVCFHQRLYDDVYVCSLAIPNDIQLHGAVMRMGYGME
jgi:hypothetical protein